MDTTAADAAGVACLNSLAPGRRILGWYAGDNVWHEMMIGLVVSSELTVIYTPDGDPYMENLTYDRASGPIKLRSLGLRLTLPRNLRAPAYRFRGAITNDLIKSVALDALKLAEDARLSPPVPTEIIDESKQPQTLEAFFGGALVPQWQQSIPGSGAVDAVDGGTPKNAKIVRPAVGDSVWLASEPLGGLELGQEVSLNEETDVQCGDRVALAFRQGEYVKVEMVRITEAADYAQRRRALFAASSDDKEASGSKPVDSDDSEVRTLWVDFDEHGERFKRWRDVVKESFTPTFEEKPLEGPATALHLIKHSERHGGDPRLWLQLWCRTKHIEPTDRVHHELKVLTDCLFYAGTFDQLNIPALVSLEVGCRRIQAIVDTYSHPSKPSWENAKIFSGQGTPEDIVSPIFRTYAAKKNKDELELLQARQKVSELKGSHAVEEGDTVDALHNKPPRGPKAKAKAANKGGGGQAES